MPSGKHRIRLLYLTKLDFPRQVANRGQIMNMAESLSKCSKFVLMVSHSYLDNERLFSYYGIESPFRIKEASAKVVPKRFVFFTHLLILLFTFRPNAVFVREEKLAYLLALFRFPFIYEAHDILDKKEKLQKKIINSSIYTVVVSKNLIDDFISKGFDEERLILLRNGVKLSHFQRPLSRVAHPVFNKDGMTNILYSGRFSRWKGVYTLIDAIAFLDDNFQLILVGGFEGEKEKILEYTEKIGVQNRVKIIGYIEHSRVHEFLMSADILVLPNSGKKGVMQHTCPLKLFEYMAAGKPIVASDLSAIREVVSEDIINFFPADDEKALATTLEAVADSPGKNMQMVERGLKLVKEYSWDSRAKKLIKLFEKQHEKFSS